MAIDVKNRKTKLDEDASIYAVRDENKSERQRWSEMTKAERRRHFKEYYLRVVIVVALAAAAFGYMVYDAVVSYRNQELSIAIINDVLEEEGKEAFVNEMMERLALDPKKDEVAVSDDFMMTGGGVDATTLQRLTALIFSETLDVIVADEGTFETYIENGTFCDLSEVLAPETLERYGDCVHEVNGRPVGMWLRDNEAYKGMGAHQTDPLVGIVNNSKRVPNAVAFMEYLFP